jgi:hypothetical protein
MIEYRMIKPMFSLYTDKPDCINMGKVYVEEGDPSGYKVANKILDGDYTLWTALMGCRWFLAAKEVWDRELDAKLYSEGMDTIRKMAGDDAVAPAQRLAASKFLATKGYRKDNVASKGRPKREDIDKAAKDLAASERDFEADLKRIKGL